MRLGECAPGFIGHPESGGLYDPALHQQRHEIKRVHIGDLMVVVIERFILVYSAVVQSHDRPSLDVFSQRPYYSAAAGQSQKIAGKTG